MSFCNELYSLSYFEIILLNTIYIFFFIYHNFIVMVKKKKLYTV